MEVGWGWDGGGMEVGWGIPCCSFVNSLLHEVTRKSGFVFHLSSFIYFIN